VKDHRNRWRHTFIALLIMVITLSLIAAGCGRSQTGAPVSKDTTHVECVVLMSRL